MKKIIATTALLFAVILYSSFAIGIVPGTPVREVNIQGRYSMMLPEYLTEGNDLNDEASLQYQNTVKEVYIIVIDESKQTYKELYLELDDYDTTKGILVNYADAQMASIRENMSKVSYESKSRTLQTGCGNAIVYDVAGYQEGIEDEMGFTVAFIEGRLNVYMIMSWTYRKDQPKYQADMDNMIISFKELSGDIDPAFAGDFEVTVANTYALTIAEGLVEDTSLNDEASLEYADYNRELYVIVIDESIADFVASFKAADAYDSKKSPLDNYASAQRESIANNMKSINELGGLINGIVNGLDTRSFVARGYYEGIEEQIYYKVQIVQGKTNFYLVMAWTMSSKRLENEPDMDMMLKSFREL